MPDKIDHIADLEQKLYARDPENMPKRKFGILRPLRQKTSSTWGEPDTKVDRTIPAVSVAGYKRFFVFSTIFFVIALGFALFSFYRGAIVLSSKNVDVTILGNSFVPGGEDLPIQVEIANKNSTDLINAKLVINYPKGATDETGSDVIRIERDIGTVPSGKTKSEEFTVILYGEQGISRDIKATLSYSLSGSNSSFEKESISSIMISSSPVALTVDAPTSVVPNQPFTINIRNSFEGDKPLGSAIVRVEYPNGFVFDKATPAPVSGNNVWTLADLTKGAVTTISIEGRLLGEEQDEKSFRIYLGAPENETSSKIAVAYNSALQTILLSKPFLNSSIVIAGQKDDTISLPIGTNISGNIIWSNDSQVTIDDPVFALSLKGASINKKSVLSEKGFYNELEGTILWTSDSDEDILNIKPGQSGILPFSFETITDTEGSRDISVSLSVSGKILETQTDQAVNNIDQKRIIFASNLNFSSTAYYSVGPIKNSGPYPPKANMATTYTVTWIIRPVENPMNSLVATATIPPGTSWSGLVAPQTEDITYNPDSKLVTWNIGSLPQATSIPKVRTVSFQVSIKPTVFQVGSKLKLLGETFVNGIDSSTNTPVNTKTLDLTSFLDQDPIYDTAKEFVLP
jgi:hypothetical protein